MKTYELVGYISEAALNDAEKSCVDTEQMNEHLNDLLTELMSKRAYQGSGAGLTYVQVMLMKDFFRKGYIAAHMVKAKE